MRVPISIVTAIILCMTVFPVPAQDVIVEFVDGVVEFRVNSTWTGLFLGDPVPGTASVRLAEDSFVELRADESTVLLSRPGTYLLSNVLGVTRTGRSSGVDALLRSRVRRLLQDDPDPGSAVGGVRSSDAVERPEVTWAGASDTWALVEDGLFALDAGAYEDAYFLFEDAFTLALPRDVDMIQFYLGYAAYLMGRRGEAIVRLETAPLDPASDYYDEHVLTLAQLWVESFAYDDAETLLADYIAHAEVVPENLQTAYLLKGLLYHGRDDAKRAREQFQAAVQIDPASESGTVAASLLHAK